MIVASPRSASAARSPDQDRRATRSPHSSSPATAPKSCSVDACLAIGGVFYVLSVRSAILAVGCAVATALLFGALAALFTPWGLPALTLPFCFGTLAFTIMKYSTDKLVPVEPADITTPEGNLRRYRQERATPADDIPPAEAQARPVT